MGILFLMKPLFGGIVIKLVCVIWAVILLAAPVAASEPARELDQKVSMAVEYKLRYADRKALELYEEVLMIQPGHREALLNAAYLNIRLGWLEEDGARKQHHYQKAYDSAVRISNLFPGSYEAHLALGAAKAKLVKFLGTGDKVRIARELEEHARFLLKRRNDNPDVWYLFGWWNFELARVSAADRVFAALLFGGLPTGASTDQAIESLEKAVALKPDYCAYQHDLGLFYERTGNPSKAREQYRKALSIPPKAPEDMIYIDKARKRLAKLEP